MTLLDTLAPLRAHGQARTRGLDDATLLDFAGRDADLVAAINAAAAEYQKVRAEFPALLGMDEDAQAAEVQSGFVNFYSQDAANPYVALAARGFAADHLDASAMLRVLGQSQRTIAGAYTTEFALIGVFASALGVAVGYLVHNVFVLLLSGLVESALPAPSLWPVAFGLGMGLTLLLAFGLPPVLQLAQVPPLRVIRRDVGGLKPASLAVLCVGVAGFAALLLAVVLGIVLLVVPSPDQIAALRAEVANLEARGGKATLTVCGPEKRLCAEIDTKAPEYGERGQFRVLKGY